VELLKSKNDLSLEVQALDEQSAEADEKMAGE